MKSKPTTLIIGAGMTGLAAAGRLSEMGLPALVLDKGRGVGGRMATRRAEGATFDHGAQYFSAKTPDFQFFVKNAMQEGVLQEWWPNISDQAHARFVGASGMSSVPKYLAKKTTVLTEKKVVQIVPDYDGWQVVTEQGERFNGGALLVTMPAPQALDLLKNSPLDLHGTTTLLPLREIAYHPCLAVLATLDGPTGIPGPGGLLLDDGDISWVADNRQKGISKSPAVTIHASPGFSTTHLDGDLQAAGELLLQAAAPWIHPARVVKWQIHRWRYSLAHRRHPDLFWQAPAHAPLLFGGDGFGIGNVEGAFLSGMTLAEVVGNRLKFG